MLEKEFDEEFYDPSDLEQDEDFYIAHPDDEYDEVDIILERNLCEHDFGYFCHKYVKINNFTNPDNEVPFRLFAYQKKLIEEAENNRIIVINQFRRAGTTTLGSVYYLWKALFEKDKKNFVILSKSDGEARYLKNLVENILKELPTWMREGFAFSAPHHIGFKNQTALAFVSNPYGPRINIDYLFINDSSKIVDMDFNWKALHPMFIDKGKVIVSSSGGVFDKWFAKVYNYAAKRKKTYKTISLNRKDNPALNYKFSSHTYCFSFSTKINKKDENISSVSGNIQ